MTFSQQAVYLFLMLGAPPFLLAGSALYNHSVHENATLTWDRVVQQFHPTPWAAVALVGYFGFQALLLTTVVDTKDDGKKTIHGFFSLDAQGRATGYSGLKMSNGLLCTLINVGVFTVGGKIGWWPLTGLYDYRAEWSSTLSVAALLLCVGLWLRGVRSLPWASLLPGLFWGTEPRPRIMDLDVKVMAVYRGGMTLWLLSIISCLFKHWETFGEIRQGMALSAVLQIAYLGLFFQKEHRHYIDTDMLVKNTGFYLCWGALAWVPLCYPSATWYLATHASWLDTSHFGWVVLVSGYGVINMVRRHNCEAQRYTFRKGAVSYPVVHNKDAALYLGGWWGRARHAHYFFDWMTVLCWTFPAMHALSGSLYLIFLFFLLWNRLHRTEAYCQKKFGPLWQEYCQRVPRRVIPL